MATEKSTTDKNEPVHEAANNPNPAAGVSPAADERTMAALAHASHLLNAVTGMGGLIAAGAIWLTQKEKFPRAAFHGLQSLVFQGLLMILVVVEVGVVWVLGFVFSFATMGIGTIVAVPIMILSMFLAFLLMGAGIAYSLYGAYQVYEGREFNYYLIGDWVQQHQQGG